MFFTVRSAECPQRNYWLSPLKCNKSSQIFKNKCLVSATKFLYTYTTLKKGTAIPVTGGGGP
jgi:hypothetical protein